MTELDQALQVLEAVENASGRIAKLDIIKKHKDNTVLRNIIEFALGDRTYGIYATSVEGKHVDTNEGDEFFNFFSSMLDMFAERTLTGYAARDVQANLWRSCTELQAKWFSRVLNRDLRVRLGKESFDSAFGEGSEQLQKDLQASVSDLGGKFTHDQIFSYFAKKGCALADEINPQSLDQALVGIGVYASYKIDGIRGFFIKTGGEVKGYSRGGKQFLTTKHIEEALMALPQDDIIFDGELIPADQTWGKALSYTRSHKRFNRDVEFQAEVRKNLQFAIFDLITIKEYMSGAPAMEQSVRYAMMENLGILPLNEKGWSPLRYVEHFVVNSLEEINTLFEKSLELKWEGLVLKYLDMPYQLGRSATWMKKKSFKTIDAPIVGWVEGNGRHVGRLGSFEVEHKGERFTVGSGFDDAERDKFWAEKQAMLGSIIEVRFQDDPEKVAKARFPVFIRLRPDKR